MTSTIESALEPVQQLDWDDLDAVATASGNVLRRVATDDLAGALERVSHDEHLLDLCEHYDILDKIVLHDDPSGFRLRLHVFLPGYFDRPHNHRWSYSSLILHGGYRHSLYGAREDLDEQVDVTSLEPILIRDERPGDTYSLHHTMVHAVVAEPYTVSLILRGPPAKKRFLVMDRTTRKAWWQFGAADEDEETAAAKRLSSDRLAELRDRLHELGVFRDAALAAGRHA